MGFKHLRGIGFRRPHGVGQHTGLECRFWRDAPIHVPGRGGQRSGDAGTRPCRCTIGGHLCRRTACELTVVHSASRGMTGIVALPEGGTSAPKLRASRHRRQTGGATQRRKSRGGPARHRSSGRRHGQAGPGRDRRRSEAAKFLDEPNHAANPGNQIDRIGQVNVHLLRLGHGNALDMLHGSCTPLYRCLLDEGGQRDQNPNQEGLPEQRLIGIFRSRPGY